MGYYIFSYGIKTNRIKKVFSSKDQELLAKVEQNDTFENYSDFQPDAFKTIPAQALKDIINGDIFDTKSNYAYGYALIGICATLGTELPYTQEIKLGYETDLINNVLSEDFRIKEFNIEEELFKDNSNPFVIPKIDDWPLIGLLTAEELVKFRAKLNDVQITDESIEAFSDTEEEDEEKEFAYEHLRGILENVNFCIENSLDMISFCH